MEFNHVNIKKDILFEVFNLENSSRRGVSDIVEKSNIARFYLLFGNLYNNNRSLFEKALIELSDIQDSAYECLQAEIQKVPYFTCERIVVNILRLRICFDIETDSIQKPLRKLLHISINRIKCNDWEIAHTGFLLYHDILQFLSECLQIGNDESSQLFREDKAKIRFAFADFIALSDVQNIETALIYKELYQYKMVSSCPVYISQAIRLYHVFDSNLVSIDIWEKYFSNHSSDSIYKDILLFEKLGFVEIPNVIRGIKSTIESMTFSSKAQKERVCSKVIKRFRANIEQALILEPFGYTIDNFLSNYKK